MVIAGPSTVQEARFRVSVFCSEISDDWKQPKLVALLPQAKNAGFSHEVGGGRGDSQIRN